MKANMKAAIVFGSPEQGVRYTERRAAYVVIINNGMVAVVKSLEKNFLPGGASLHGEAPEKTVAREVYEELGQGVRLIRKLGEAVQYFYSAADDRHYKMLAVFFAGEFTDKSCPGTGEHELFWMPITEAREACFHACHAWAVCRA